MSAKSVKGKLILPLIAFVFLMTVAMTVISSIKFASFNENLVLEKLELVSNGLKNELHEFQRESFSASAAVACDTELTAAVKTKDADVINNLLKRSLGIFTVDYFTVYDENGVMLASTDGYTGSVHYPAKHVTDALDGSISTYYEENNEIKVSVCTGAPVFAYDGTLLGVVSAGIRLDKDAFVDEIKSLYGVEATVFYGDTRYATTIIQNGKRAVGTKLSQDIAKSVLDNKQEYYGEADILGAKYKTVYIPLINGENKAFAIIFIGVSSQSVSKQTNVFVHDSIVIGLVSLLSAAILFACLITRTVAPISRLIGSLNEVADGNLKTEIDVRSSDEIGRLSAAVKRVTGIFYNLLEDVNIMVSAREMGDIDFFIDSGKYRGDYKRLADDIYTLINTSHMDTMGLINLLEEFNNGNFDADIPKLPGKKYLMNQRIDNIRSNMKNIGNEIGRLTEQAVNGNLSDLSDTSRYDGEWKRVIEGLNGLLIAVAKPVDEVIMVLSEVSKGNFDIYMTGDYRGDFASIKTSLNTTVHNISGYIKEISAVLNDLANNNLEQEITKDYVGEFVSIKMSLNNIIEKLNKVLNGINITADQVSAGARQLSETSAMLAEGASEQAASVEELNATVMTVNDKTAINAQNAKKAKELSNQSSKSASAGNKEMERMLAAMDEIKQSSGSISKIIKTIDDISFQTNLLAVNAAIEAARAREYGKGFAVVSDEVRSLSVKSRTAAKETTELIENSIQKVNEGIAIAAKTAKGLNNIVASVTEVSEIISEIADSSDEQASAVAQINEGVSQISQVVQANAASSEESAAASQELSVQSDMLKGMIQSFKLKRL